MESELDKLLTLRLIEFIATRYTVEYAENISGKTFDGDISRTLNHLAISEFRLRAIARLARVHGGIRT